MVLERGSDEFSTLFLWTYFVTNPLGSKGMGDGSSMLTPVVMANAVADALGREKIDLPLTLNKVWELAKESKN